VALLFACKTTDSYERPQFHVHECFVLFRRPAGDRSDVALYDHEMAAAGRSIPVIWYPGRPIKISEYVNGISQDCFTNLGFRVCPLC
jgi:hypothetical protein